MKQCPSCLTTYTDDTLRFCLADGSILGSIDDEQSTMVRGTGIGYADKTVVMGKVTPVRVEIPSGVDIEPRQRAAAVSSGSSSGSSIIFKVVIIVIGLAILGGLVAFAAGVIVYYNSGMGIPVANNTNTKQPQTSPTPAKDDRDELRDQIANLEKQLNEQNKNKQIANVPLSMPKQSSTMTNARANSPNDGFLALRSLPSSEIGDRIAKIPHGATLSIGACGPVIKPVAKSGRWCQATYNGYSGWVFDAFIRY